MTNSTPFRIAINGYGRIGQCVLRALYENGYRDHLQVVAINELSDIDTIAHLTKYDSTHGRFHGEVAVDGDNLVVNGDRIRVDRKSTRLNSSHVRSSYAVFCLKTTTAPTAPPG